MLAPDNYTIRRAGPRREALHQVLRSAAAGFPILLAIAAIIMAFEGNSASFFQDESFVVWLAKPGLRHILEYLHYEPHPPLYHSILALWMGLAGDSEQSVRALSGLFYLLSLVATAWLGRSLLRWDELIIVLTLLACSPMLLDAAHFARMYALVFLESSLALLAFLGVFVRRSARTAMTILLAAANLAGLFTHYYFLFLIIAQAVVFLVFIRRNWAAACLGLLVPGVLFLAMWGTHLISQLASDRFAANMPEPFGWGDVAAEVLAYYRKRWIMLLVWLAAVFLVSWPDGHLRRRSWRVIKANLLAATRERRLRMFALAWVTAFAAALTVGAVGGPRYWHGGTTCLAELLPLTMVLALILRRGTLKLNVAAVCAVLVSTVVLQVRAANIIYAQDSDHRASIQRLKDVVSDGDVVVGLDNYITLFYYYTGRAPGAKRVQILAYPPDFGSHPGWLNQTATLKDLPAFKAATRKFALQLAHEQTAAPGRRLWLIPSDWSLDGSHVVTEIFDATLRRVETVSVVGGTGYSQFIAYEPR